MVETVALLFLVATAALTIFYILEEKGDFSLPGKH